MTRMYLENKLLLEGGEEANSEFPMELEYYLVESDMKIPEDSDEMKVYGIGIVKKTKEVCCESKLIADFSCCITRTKEVLKKLISNSVTPVALNYVLEDIIST